MADDIIGHDHLDHDRHLTHRNPTWKPGERYSRGKKPNHVALSVRHNIRTSGSDAYAHLHRGDAADDAETNALSRSTASARLWLLGGLLGGAILLALAWNVIPALGLFVVLLALNTVIELHKRFTQGVPVDFEILFAGAAVLSALHGVFAGVALALVGPLLAASVRGHVCPAVIRKSGALLVTALAASVLAPTRFELLFAVILGIGAYFAIITASGLNRGPTTILARFTTLALNAFLVFSLLPAVLPIQ
jgi:hypothetical protein